MENIDIQQKIEQNKREIELQNLTEPPYIDEDYYCQTCGSTSGKCHPDTGMCFICGADDWAPIYTKK